MIRPPPLIFPGRGQPAPLLRCACCRRPIRQRPRTLWRPRDFWRPRIPVLNAGHLMRGADGHLLRHPTTGHLLRDDGSGNSCCCGCASGKKCFTEWRITWTCTTSTWGSWSNFGNKCLAESTTTARTLFTGGPVSCTYRQYVPVNPKACCTVDGDCSTTASAPAAPTDTPSDCVCNQCDCTDALPHDVQIMTTGITLCTACYQSADVLPASRASAHVNAGSADQTTTITRGGGTCQYLGNGDGPEFHLHCSSNNCNEADIDTAVWNAMRYNLSRTAASTWRLTIKPWDGSSSPGTTYFDATFTWKPCDGAITVNNGNTTCSFTNTFAGFGSCPNPDTAGHDGTATITPL